MSLPFARRSVRVGVLIGQTLVEERVFQAVAPVTLGHSLHCNLSVPVDGVPSEHVLFAVDQGQLLLRVTERMAGRLAQGDAIQTELRVGPGVDGVWTVPLAHGSRGRLELGDATILFQEIATPPKAPRPRLPASVRGTLGDRVDRRLAVIISGSILAHCAIATWAWVTERESGMVTETSSPVAYEQSNYTITAPDFDEPTPGEPGAATPVSEVQTPAPIVSRPSRPNVGRQPGMTERDAEYLAKILAGNGETGNADEMRGRRPGADLGAQLDHIRDHGTIGKPGGGFREPSGSRLGTVDGPVIKNPTQVTEVKKSDEQDRGRIEIRPQRKDGPTTTLTVDTVLAKIKSNYMAGLQRCYKTGLAGDAGLGGTVDIAFMVGENGAVQDPSASGLTRSVDGCIRGQMASWRFPIPNDKDGAAEASFTVALALHPN
ncbi:MAG: AgmX/PglI C-terminal domain-containing protein [Kofleriaceae bacterium]